MEGDNFNYRPATGQQYHTFNNGSPFFYGSNDFGGGYGNGYDMQMQYGGIGDYGYGPTALMYPPPPPLLQMPMQLVQQPPQPLLPACSNQNLPASNPPVKLLVRPKSKKGQKKPPEEENGPELTKRTAPSKTLQQREIEYAAARKRILGDVSFPQEEKEAKMEEMLSPAEILQLKINQALLLDNTNTYENPIKVK